MMENWAKAPEVLAEHARHVLTGDPVPPTLLERIRNAEAFNLGFKAISYTSSALVDMALHLHPDPTGIEISAFEAEECKRLGVPPEVGIGHRLPHFRHLFGGRYYAAGYYVYMWAGVLEAEAFNAFEDAGNVFDPGLAEKLERFIFSAGDSRDPRTAFRAFCGRDPQTTAMLRRRDCWLVEARSNPLDGVSNGTAYVTSVCQGEHRARGKRCPMPYALGAKTPFVGATRGARIGQKLSLAHSIKRSLARPLPRGKQTFDLPKRSWSRRLGPSQP